MPDYLDKQDFAHIERKAENKEATAVCGLGAYLIILIVLIAFIGVD